MTEQAVLEYVINSIWQVPLLAAMAWLLVWIGRPTAKIQHCIWLMTLALSILLPLLGAKAFTAAPSVAETATRSAAMQPIQAESAANHSEIVNSGALVARSGQVSHLPRFGIRTLRMSQTAVDWMLALYLIVIMGRFVQLAFAWLGARRLFASAPQKKLSLSERAILEDCCVKLHVQEPKLVTSREITSPMTIGVLQPALMLPETFTDSTESEMAAMLCHELAHVRRRDTLANWVCQLSSLPIAYHPATYGVHRRIRQSRELVCDAMAATAMSSATGYARCLVTLAQRMLDGERLPQSVQAAGLFDHDVLEERIMRLLERKNTMSLRARILRSGCAMALTAAVITTAAVFHVTPTVVNAAETNTTVAVQMDSDARSAAVPALAQATPEPAPIPMQQAVPMYGIVPVRVVLTAPVLARVRITSPVRVAVRAYVSTPIQIAAAVQATNPAPAPVPQIDTAPTVHPAPVKPAPVPSIAPAPSEPVQPEANQHGTIVRHRDQIDLTPEQRARMEANMAAAREQIREATKKFQSPEFKKQMADMQRQMAEATKQMQSEEVRQQLKMLQSPEYKKQMADMQRQIKEATKQFDSQSMRLDRKGIQQPDIQPAPIEKKDSTPR